MVELDEWETYNTKESGLKFMSSEKHYLFLDPMDDEMSKNCNEHCKNSLN